MNPGPQGGLQTIDLIISIPELSDINSFFVRGFPTHHTFEELYQECVNHPEVARAQRSLERVRASRHFWVGDKMMSRRQSVASGIPGGAGNEVSLILRRDYYKIGPKPYVAGEVEYLYLDAEAPVAEIVGQTLSKDERACCFDLCDTHGKRLAQDQNLSSYGMFPAWEDAKDAFPNRAILTLKPHISWQSYALLAVALLLGTTIGYFVLAKMLAPKA